MIDLLSELKAVRMVLSGRGALARAQRDAWVQRLDDAICSATGAPLSHDRRPSGSLTDAELSKAVEAELSEIRLRWLRIESLSGDRGKYKTTP